MHTSLGGRGTTILSDVGRGRPSSSDRHALFVFVVTVALMVLFVPTSIVVFGVRYTYTLRTVAFGGALLGAVSGFLGCFAVLRKQSLLGDALSHAALPGVAVAFLIAGRELGALLLGAAVASWLGVGFIRLISGNTRIKDDTAMGIVLTGWFAAGIVGLTYIQGRPDASQAGLDSFIFGQAAAIVRSDVRLVAVVSAISLVVVTVFWKQFKLIAFDSEFAGANGFRVALWNGLLSALVVIAIVMGLQLAGVILMVGMLIAPGVAARQWTDRLGHMTLLAGLFGALSGAIGAILSAVDNDLPTGPMIIVTATSIVFISISLAPRRGVVWTFLARRADSRRFAMRTLLRDVYHYSYDHGCDNVPEDFLVGVRGRAGRRALRALLGRRLLMRIQEGADKASWCLTEEGADIARSDARNQRLWDLYRELADKLDLPVVPEERERDIRAVLPHEAVESLEEMLGEKGAEPRVRG